MRKIAIYISSFDGYSDIWTSFFRIWETYWPDCPYQMYLTTNEKKYVYRSLKVLSVGKETTWLNRTLKTLNMVEEDYIIFFLEDYFISKKVNSEFIIDIIEYMQDQKIFYYQLSRRKNLPKDKKNIQVEKTIAYPISLQLAVWKRKKLIELLKEIKQKDGYNSPWDFERYFVDLYKDKSGVLKGVRYDTRDLFGYKNGVLQGKWIRETVKFYKKQGIPIDCSKRKKMSYKETLYYNLKKYSSAKFSNKYKKIIKKFMKKIGFTFMTD